MEDDNTDRRLADLVTTINDAGWLVSGLHQTSKDVWTASVRKGTDWSSGYASARDPIAALALAWTNRKKTADTPLTKTPRIRINK